jgi:hypothetical protein
MLDESEQRKSQMEINHLDNSKNTIKYLSKEIRSGSGLISDGLNLIVNISIYCA